MSLCRATVPKASIQPGIGQFLLPARCSMGLGGGPHKVEVTGKAPTSENSVGKTAVFPEITPWQCFQGMERSPSPYQ